jgi:adenylylsulfate kinase-like enzyme
VKGIYDENKGITELVGVDIGFDEPNHPNLVINVDDETETESIAKIINYIEGKQR